MAALRRAAAARGGLLPPIAVADALLDERNNDNYLTGVVNVLCAEPALAVEGQDFHTRSPMGF